MQGVMIEAVNIAMYSYNVSIHDQGLAWAYIHTHMRTPGLKK